MNQALKLLSGRQYQIMEMIASGLSAPEIAEKLNLTPGTVNNILNRYIYPVLEAKNRVDAVNKFNFLKDNGLTPEQHI